MYKTNYDIMTFTEDSNVPGMLVSIDFEKAFDSISWSFIYKTLEYYGLTHKLIKWIKLFNQDIKATIFQCGVLSDFINIERGCRQGDPISAYLFIMAAQILTVLIKTNKTIEGIRCSIYFIYLGFYVSFNTVQVISRRVVGRAEETSTYSSLGFCTVNCRPTASNYQLSHLRLCRESNPGLRGGRRECYHSVTMAPYKV